MYNVDRAYRSIPEGQTVTNPKPGDFFLTHGHGPIQRLIQFGQRIRFRGATRKFANWNHAGLFVDDTGTIIESHARTGVHVAHISDYHNVEYTVVRVTMTEADRVQVLKFARWAVGKKYGYLTDLSLAFAMLLGGRFAFSLDGQEICSGLVARALERTGEIFDRDPSRVMPADLARHFQVDPPT